MNTTDGTTRRIPNKNDRPLVTLDNNALQGYFNVEDNVPYVTDKNREDAKAVQKLLGMHHLGAIRLIVGISTALEKKRPGDNTGWQIDIARLEALGIDHDGIFASPYLSIGNVWDRFIHALLFEGKTEANARNVDFGWHAYRDRECERLGIIGIDWQALRELDDIRIHGNIPVSPLNPFGRQTPALDNVCLQQRQRLESILNTIHDSWMNAKNDALGLYNHMTHAFHTSVPEHAVFVTSDKGFKRHIWTQVNGKRVQKTAWDILKERGFPGQLLTPEEAVDYLSKATGVELTDNS